MEEKENKKKEDRGTREKDKGSKTRVEYKDEEGRRHGRGGDDLEGKGR